MPTATLINYVDPFGASAELSQAGHTTLDAAGFWPGAGIYFDVTNGVWYAAEGDWANFGWSGLAAIPGVGYFSQGAKYGIKAVSKIDDVYDVAKGAKSAGKQFKVDKIDLQMFAEKGAGKAGVRVKDLKRLPDSKIKALGGEGYTQPINEKTGKSKADLYWNPKTGEVRNSIK
jgi:hypothetical protein